MSDRRAAVPLRPLGLVELLDGAVRLVRSTPRASFTVALPFAFVRAAVVAVVALASRDSSDTQTFQVLTLLGVAALVGTVRTGALAPLYSAELIGTRLGAAATLRRAGRSLPALCGLAVVLTVAQSAGALALGVAGVWLWGVWAVAAPALVLERLGPLRALGRSVELVRGAFWRTWGTRALAAVATYVLGLLISAPFSAVGALVGGSNPLAPTSDGSVPPGTILLAALGTLVAATVVAPVSSAVDVLLYVDRRMRREGMDLVMALPAPYPAPSPAPTPVTAW